MASDEDPIQLTDDDHVPPSDDELLSMAIPIEQIDQEPAAEEPEPDLFEPIALSDVGSARKQIKVTGDKRSHDDHWSRKTNVTGEGATHMRTFVAKLRIDAIDHLDQTINEWLDAHPEYEVKFVSTSVGTLTGKLKEPALFMNVWV